MQSSQGQDTSKSWTDDLPVCKLSGVGFSTNQIYREDGSPQEDHKFEDRSFHCKFDDTCYLYEVFDGHEGTKAVDFCFQRMAAEILLGQLNEKKTDEEVKEVLRQAFNSVEKAYMESIYDLLAERTSLQCDIPENLTYYEAYQKVPQVVENIKKINQDLSSGTAVAIALIYNNKLYVANVGNCRVLFCHTDHNCVLKVVQLSIDHDLKNEDELLRLSQIGLDADNLRKCSHLGNQQNTRCLGNYLVKDGYKELDDTKMAVQEPVMAEPDIHGGIVLDKSSQFMLLMSAGLYKCIEEATETDEVNKYIAHSVVEQFREQSTLTGVAQAVVDRAVRLHHDWCMSHSINSANSGKHEDITLIVRNFNFPQPNVISSSPPYPPPGLSTIVINNRHLIPSFQSVEKTRTLNTNNTSSSSDTRSEIDTGVGPDQKIEPYVDFSEYFKNLALARKKGMLPEGVDF